MSEINPKHIAIIMDGNGRWAKDKGLERIQGHAEGVRAVLRTVEACIKHKIELLTLYAFSTENWKRSEDEVSALMLLLGESLRNYLPDFMKQGIRVRSIGNVSELPDEVCKSLNEVKEKTATNTALTLNLALNYGGRDEIVRATRKILVDQIDSQNLTEELLASYLDTADLPDPELLIRTSGEMRVSNFLLWQISYSEFVALDEFWPDFNEQLLLKALDKYKNRSRRFGGR